MKDNWVRCVDCGRKVHHKKIWDCKGKWQDAGDEDKPHRCNACEHIKMKGL